jgi:hypothetical protein
MLKRLAQLLPRSATLDMALGDIVFDGEKIAGQYSRSYIQARIKASVDGSRRYLSLAMKPDAYAGPDGSPTNYLNLDLAAALQLRANLDETILKLQEFDQDMKAMAASSKP